MRKSSFTVAAAGVAAVSLASLGMAAPASADTSPGLVYTANPPLVQATSLSPHALPTSPKDCLAATGGVFACQTPDSIRAAYGIPTTVNGQLAGTGQTVVIVDAFGSPTVRSDLHTFDQAFGLPDPTLNIFYPGGMPTWQGTANQLGWAEETSLDVQWAHAVAPGATIDLVVATTNYGDSLNLAQQYAVDHHLGNVMSLSFGEAENLIHGNNSQVAQAHDIYQEAKAAGITVFASSGDSGSDNGAGYGNFGFPAADPLVTAVGGTALFAGDGVKAHRNTREVVWGDYTGCPYGCQIGPIGATGGAVSTLGGKDGSDVSYNASVYTGVLTYLGFMGGDANGFYFFGGTSAGSPQWAAGTAVIDQALGHSVGYIRDDLSSWARAGALYDVTVGNNETPTFTGGYSATAGRDLPTGWGSPDFGAIINQLAASSSSHASRH